MVYLCLTRDQQDQQRDTRRIESADAAAAWLLHSKRHDTRIAERSRVPIQRVIEARMDDTTPFLAVDLKAAYAV